MTLGPLGRARRTLVLATVLVTLGASGCSKKLSSGGGAMDVLFYDLLGMDRDTAYYYDVLQNAHDRTTFCYRSTDDPYLADKCVDAITHLGKASYNRLEGEVQVILLLSDVLIEDPSALARANAAGSLALLGTKLPATPEVEKPERGDRYLALLKELDAMHDGQGRRRADTPATRQRVAQIVEEIGSFKFPNLQLTKDGLRFFPTRAYITQETDLTLRDVYDRAMVRRSRAVIFATLEGGILDRNQNVRIDAVKGLKTLAYAGSLDAVVERLSVENHPLVRAEMAEYLGRIGGAKAAGALVGMLRDDDGGVRHRARLALSRLAGQDLGKEPEAWDGWLAKAFPSSGPAATPSGGPASGSTTSSGTPIPPPPPVPTPAPGSGAPGTPPAPPGTSPTPAPPAPSR